MRQKSPEKKVLTKIHKVPKSSRKNIFVYSLYCGSTVLTQFIKVIPPKLWFPHKYFTFLC